MSRNWMYNRRLPDGSANGEYINGVETFMKFATEHVNFMSNGEVRCPCTKCQNGKYQSQYLVTMHLLHFGFTPNYCKWIHHGEPFDEGSSSRSEVVWPSREEYRPISTLRQMVYDVAGPEFEQRTEVPEQEPNPEAKAFYDLLHSLDEELYPGCENVSIMSMMARVLTFKSESSVSERGYDTLLQLFRDVLPSDHKLAVSNFYETKKLLSGLGLPVQKIDCCPTGCMLYWKENSLLESCTVCNHPRFKENRFVSSRSQSRHAQSDATTSVEYESSSTRKKVPFKRMFYFPLGPRLRRLYYSRATAGHMTWHHEHVCAEDTMCHPCDSEAWKHFNSTNEQFSSEPRNVRLALCTDGFQPFGQSGQQYSCWPVIVTPYNLPPGMCLKQPVMFLTVLVPGPNNPKHMIDVFLQPLIEELNELWVNGVAAYDVSRMQNFTLRAGLLWTVSDFPAYAMLSGWSTAGKLACPYCTEWSEAFYLFYGHKMSWFDSHRKFLPMDHRYRRNKTKFIRNQVKVTSPPQQLNGEELLSQIENLGLLKMTAPNAEKVNGEIFRREECGWRKKSIFWDLPYWKTNLIRHNLDVMHIEKNFFENLFNTVMNVEGKTKDNAKAREDCQKICNRPELARDPESRKYPKACYSLDKAQRKLVCDWVKELKFPDGYVSKLARCVDEKKYKLFGMKSHDCHVFMQRLLPIAFRELLPIHVWESITEISKFFSNLCSNVLKVSDMRKLEEDIPVILCKLEMIFPPAFFNSMEHLPVHLPYEARVAGPVHYRWMYPFERYLGPLKKKVTNKARVEGSICNAYLVEEAANFCSFYFEPNVYTRARKVPRNDSVGASDSGPVLGGLESFSNSGRFYGQLKKQRWLDDREYIAAHSYILLNTPEMEVYIQQYREYLCNYNPTLDADTIELQINSGFAGWFAGMYNHIDNLGLRSLCVGPGRKVSSYSIYFINGYKFHTAIHGAGRAYQNSFVSVVSEGCEYYGQINEILEIEYPGSLSLKMVVFKCHWYDPTPGVGINIHPDYKIIEVNVTKSYNRYEPFILAAQAIQVYLAHYPSSRRRADWAVVCRVKARGVYDLPGNQVQRAIQNVAFQEDEGELLTIVDTNEDDVPTSLADPNNALEPMNIDSSDEIEHDVDTDVSENFSDYSE